jgi:hypothetical protein
MQYKVPQNVDIEDRVIGPLTLRQFVMITVAAAVCLVLYFIFIGPLRIFFWLFGGLIMGGALFLAFAKYGDQNMEIFALSAFSTLTNPRKRVWKKEAAESKHVEQVQKKTETPQAGKKSLEDAKDDLEKLAQIVDSGGNIAMGDRDRIVPFGTHIEDNSAPDILDKTERPSPIVDPLIDQGAKSVPKREPLLSEVASVSPDQKFDYNKIEIKDAKISRF